MKIANILPANMVNENMVRQPIEMYLTHIILAYPERFAFLKEDKDKGIECYKILDNSACELGNSLDIKEVLKAAEIIGASEIILPDKLQKGDSLSRTLEYLSELGEVPYNLMAVAQGENREEVLKAIEQICCIKRIDTIGIPKWYCSLESTNGLGRHSLVRYAFDIMKALNSLKQIHLLGCDVGMRELIFSHSGVVRSCDTGYFTTLATSLWESTHFTEDRPRELKINLHYMGVEEKVLARIIGMQRELLDNLDGDWTTEMIQSSMMGCNCEQCQCQGEE